MLLLLHDFTVNTDGDDLPGDEFPAVLECFLGRHLQTAAAGNFHSYNGYALNVVTLNDCGQFFAVIHLVQFGAADESQLVPDKILMKACVSIGGAIGGDQKLCAVKIGGADWCQFDLYRPVPEPF